MKCLSNLPSVQFDNAKVRSLPSWHVVTSESPMSCDLPKGVITFLDSTQRMALCNHVCVLICLVSVLIMLIIPLAGVCVTVSLACVQSRPGQTSAYLCSCMRVGRDVGEHYQGRLGHAGTQRGPRGLS